MIFRTTFPVTRLPKISFHSQQMLEMPITRTSTFFFFSAGRAELRETWGWGKSYYLSSSNVEKKKIPPGSTSTNPFLGSFLDSIFVCRLNCNDSPGVHKITKDVM